MKTVLPINWMCFAALTVTLFRCDIIEKDATPVEVQKVDMYVQPNKQAVMDMPILFPGFKDASVIDGNASIKYFDRRYIKYSLQGIGNGKFGVNVESSDGKKLLANVRVTSQSQTESCNQTEAFTYAKITNDTKLVVNLLANPEFCGYDIYSKDAWIMSLGDPRPGIDQNENSEGILVAVCACGDNGDTGILTYVPPKGFIGQVKYKYYIGAIKEKPGMDNDYYNIWKYPDHFEYASIHDVIIDVVAPESK